MESKLFSFGGYSLRKPEKCCYTECDDVGMNYIPLPWRGKGRHLVFCDNHFSQFEEGFFNYERIQGKLEEAGLDEKR